MTTRYDVLIVGGGVIGAAIADRLAGEGKRVCVLERGLFARESSWAAPGVVHPIHPWKYPDPMPVLLKQGMKEHPALAADLVKRTGIDPELRRTGLVVMGEAASRVAEWWGSQAPWEMRQDGSIFLPEACSIRPQRFTRALLEGAHRRGAVLRDRTPALEVEPGRVRVPGGDLEADHVVLSAGAWSGGLRREAPTVPVRGQILLYRGEIPHMVIYPDASYAVPRPEGLVLFGTTVEHAGFDSAPTEEAVTRLQQKAWEHARLAPEDLLAAWAGLRPGTPTELPYICAESGLIYATGHYRSGIILAPLTARWVAGLVAGKRPEFSLPLPN
ncbi:MAG: NAD(P)/FAD-dependent oxidoreductase [Planctomycetota bacterium]|jgi:glycine oxidase